MSDAAARGHDRLAALDDQAVRAIERLFRAVYREAVDGAAPLDELLDGAAVIAALYLIQDELEALLARIIDLAEQAVAGVYDVVLRAKVAAVVAGQATAIAMLGGKRLPRLTTEAKAAIAHRGRDGQAMRTLVDEQRGRVGDVVRRRVMEGIGAQAIKEQLGLALGEVMHGAQALSHSEVVGGFRDASHETARLSGRAVGWRWIAAVESSPQPCVVCYAMHGTWHRMDETLDSHIGCRCVARYETAEDQGADETLGEELFAALPDEVQQTLLGPGAFAAYRDGRFQLRDFVDTYQHPRYGRSLRRRPNVALGITRKQPAGG